MQKAMRWGRATPVARSCHPERSEGSDASTRSLVDPLGPSPTAQDDRHDAPLEWRAPSASRSLRAANLNSCSGSGLGRIFRDGCTGGRRSLRLGALAGLLLGLGFLGVLER